MGEDATAPERTVDLARRPRGLGSPWLVILGLLLAACGGGGWLLSLRGNRVTPPPQGMEGWSEHAFPEVGVSSLRTRPEWSVERLERKIEIRIPRRSGDASDAIVCALTRAPRGEGLSGQGAARSYVATQAERLGEEGSYLLERSRFLDRGRRLVAYEVLIGRRATLLEALPDLARGDVEHRIFVEPPSGAANEDLLTIRYVVPQETALALEDEVELMLSSLEVEE